MQKRSQESTGRVEHNLAIAVGAEKPKNAGMRTPYKGRRSCLGNVTKGEDEDLMEILQLHAAEANEAETDWICGIQLFGKAGACMETNPKSVNACLPIRDKQESGAKVTVVNERSLKKYNSLIISIDCGI
jgi:hypothetical protein